MRVSRAHTQLTHLSNQRCRVVRTFGPTAAPMPACERMSKWTSGRRKESVCMHFERMLDCIGDKPLAGHIGFGHILHRVLPICSSSSNHLQFDRNLNLKLAFTFNSKRIVGVERRVESSLALSMCVRVCNLFGRQHAFNPFNSSLSLSIFCGKWVLSTIPFFPSDP